MVVVAGGEDQLAPRQRPADVLEHGAGDGHRLAHGPVTKLEHVAEQDEAIDAVEALDQRRPQPLAAEDVDARVAAQVQIGDDQRPHRVR